MIDINAYTGNWPFRPLPDSTPKTLTAALDTEGIGLALVSPIEGIFYAEPQLANEELFEALRNFPALKPVAVLNPTLPNWRRNLDVCCEKYHVCALKLHPNYHHYDLGSDDANALLEAAGEKNIPVIIQLRIQDVRAQDPSGIVHDVNVSDAINAVRACPNTGFVIGGIRWGEATGRAKEIMELPNLWIDISQIEYTDCLRQIIGIYGVQQLLLGTHAPFFVIQSAILKLQEAELSQEEQGVITSGNACKVLEYR